MLNIHETLFFKLGSVGFTDNNPVNTFLTGICNYDATFYNNNKPKKFIVRNKASPHLSRYINLLDSEMPELKTYIQNMWDISNNYIENLNLQVYQTFFIITHKQGVKRHRHGTMLGDTITFFSTIGQTNTQTYLYLDDVKIEYPETNSGLYALCFAQDMPHYTESLDSNYHFHFVYDLTELTNVLEKNVMIKIK